MVSIKDFRILFLYEFNLKHNAAKAMKNSNLGFREGTTSQRTICRCFKTIRTCDINLDDEPRGRLPSVVNEKQLRNLVEANP